MASGLDSLTIKMIRDTLSQHKQVLGEKYGVRDIGIFGSYVRGEADDNSDIDILVDLNKSFKTFDNYMELKFFLEDLFHKRIDLILRDSLKEKLKDYIFAETLYV